MGHGRVYLSFLDFCAGGAGAGLAEFQQVVEVEEGIDRKAVVAGVHALDKALQGEVHDALVGVGYLAVKAVDDVLDPLFDVVAYPGLEVYEQHAGVDVGVVFLEADPCPVLLADAVHHAAGDVAFEVLVVEFTEGMAYNGVGVQVKCAVAVAGQQLGKEKSGEGACGTSLLAHGGELLLEFLEGDELEVSVVVRGDGLELFAILVLYGVVQHIHGDVCHVLVVLEQREHGYAENLGEVVIAGVDYVDSRPPPKFPVTIPTISHPFCQFPAFCAGRQCRET